MAKALNIGYNTILRIENDNFNRKLNHQSIIILNKIIDYMDIRDKLNFSNNDYLDFILNKQSSIIVELKEKIGRIKLAKELKVSPDSVTRWINNEVVISKENYAKLKEILKNYIVSSFSLICRVLKSNLKMKKKPIEVSNHR